MRAFLPAYHLETVRDLKDALDRLNREPGRWKPFAGGTDLMVLLEAGKLPHHNFLSIWNLPELRGIEVTPDHVSIGAATTYTELRDHDTLQREFPLLVQAASETGAIATQNRGTIGGNIANGSPAADSPPALLVYDAEIELLSAQGARRRPFQGFHSAYKQMDLRPDELVGQIHLPRIQQQWREEYRKVGTRRAQAISKVCFAARALLEDDRIADIRLAFSSVAPIALRVTKTEQTLRGKELTPQIARAAAEQLAREISPIDDVRSTANYRSRVAQSLLTQFLEALSSH